ncbi:heavy metal translocating P-type ATPase [Sulfurospirillum sp. 1307]|jgi:Cu+-exporting ATPase
MPKEKINLNISGMTCVNCSNGIKRVVNKLDGVESSTVNFASNAGEFVIDTSKVDKTKIIEKIKKLGYGVVEDLEALEKEKEKSYKKLKSTFFVSAFFTLYIFIFMFFPVSIIKNEYILLGLGSVVQFYVGKRFYNLAFSAIKHKNYDMNVLVALGTSAAYFYSAFVVLFPDLFPQNLRFVYFDGAAVIITFVLLGRLLEERSKAKATNFLKALMDLAPNKANLVKNHEVTEVNAKDLHVKDIVLVKQGEVIPADGVVIEGTAEIDTSMITGEPMPKTKTIQDEVIAGTINQNGIIKVEVKKEPNDTKLSQIISLLNEAQNKKMPIARFADKVANIFVPTVIGISILTFIIWAFFVGDLKSAILASISVLIISCPCALGLATPIAIVSSVGKGAKEGILIKNPEVLEIIRDIKFAIFDKTGTITKGEIEVDKMNVEDEYLPLICSAEVQSEHPISKAIVTWAKKNNIKTDIKIDEIKIEPGFGLIAYTKDKKIVIGNMALFEKENLHVDKNQQEILEKFLDDGSGAILAGIDDKCVGVISLKDGIKDDAKEMITHLKQNHITPILLTGDNEITAKKVASKIGIDLVYAEVLPDEKYKVIKDLQKEAKVMFVGDGINDSISIKQADIGVVLASGSDITKDAGDIILVNNKLNAVSKSLNLSIKTMKTIKQNLFWAFFYNSIGIPIAAGILYPFFGIMLSPMYAGIAMSFSSVTVVLNSLRLKFSKL